MEKIKGICLDLDQTLCNNEDFIFKPNNLAFPNHKKTCEWQVYKFLKPHLKIISWEEFIEVYGISKKEVKVLIKRQAASHSRYLYIQRTLENLNMRFKPDLVYKATNIFWNYMLQEMQLFPHVKKVLHRLKENHLKICIVSDLTADIQNKKLQHLGVQNYIDYLVTSEEVGADKPDPRQLHLALEKMNLEKNEVLVIGNNPKTDVQLGNNTGVETILFDYNKDYVNKADHNNATHYVNNFNEILKIMKLEKKQYSLQKLFVFDMIGTLTTERHLISVVLQNILPDKDYTVIKKYYELYKVNKISREEFWKKLKVENIEEVEKKLLENIKIRDGMFDLIKEMRAEFKLAILSNIPKEWGSMISKKYGFEKYFDEIVFSGDYGVKKPNSEIYKLLLEKFPNINPHNTYFIDDSLGDLESGKNLLMQTIWLQNQDRKNTYIPDFVVKDVKELRKLKNTFL